MNDGSDRLERATKAGLKIHLSVPRRDWGYGCLCVRVTAHGAVRTSKREEVTCKRCLRLMSAGV